MSKTAEKTVDFALHGRKGGQAKTEAKAKASQTNGRKGGRPPEWFRQLQKKLPKLVGKELTPKVSQLVLEQWKTSKEANNHE